MIVTINITISGDETNRVIKEAKVKTEGRLTWAPLVNIFEGLVDEALHEWETKQQEEKTGD